ncbi:MAG TPA: hypothetical protein VEV17_26710 [Bryobacteraceae bacterium]|nr:hypothetical protein [Bryobacteraceae bacterium]
MRNIAKFLVSVAVTLLVLTAGSLQAANEDTCQPINSAPVTISTSGTYCLTADISYTAASGNAITVNAGHVVLDLSQHTLSNLAAGTGTLSTGISSSSANLTVRNGTVIGFSTGISLAGSGALVEGIRADANRQIAIIVGGLGSVVRNNLVIHTGTGNASEGGLITAIYLLGDGERALNNDIVDTVPPTSGVGSGRGIVVHANGVVVEGNRLSNSTAPSTSSPSVSLGILFDGAYTGLAVNNRVVIMTYGVYMAAAPAVAYRDNLAIGVVSPYTGGNNAGDNQSF